MFFIGLYAIFAIKYVRKELTGMKVYYCKKKFKRKFKEQKFQHFCSHFFSLLFGSGSLSQTEL